MIKPRRIGHATFETADLDKQIAYWTEVAGLVLAEREKSRAFLATKTGVLVGAARTVRSRALLQTVVRGGAQFGFCANWRRRWRRTASRASCATIPYPAWARCSPSRTTRAPASICSPNGAISASITRSAGIGPLKLGHIAFHVPGREGDGGFLRQGDGLSRLRLDRGLVRVHALQRGPSHREFHQGRQYRDAPHRLRAEGHVAHAERLRDVRA